MSPEGRGQGTGRIPTDPVRPCSRLHPNRPGIAFLEVIFALGDPLAPAPQVPILLLCPDCCSLCSLSGAGTKTHGGTLSRARS